jgi:aspartyl protease family protein
VLSDIKASLIPGLPDGGVLLGMNVLKNLELIQRADELIIRQYY